MLDQLKKLAAKLGRTPYTKELIAATRRGECADVSTFYRYFGNYNKALIAAGMRPNFVTYSRAQLILMLQALAKKLGHRPTLKEIDEARLRGECASSPTYYNYFGNLPAAIREAGLDRLPARMTPRKPPKRQQKRIHGKRRHNESVRP